MIRDKLEAHAAACRRAVADGGARPRWEGGSLTGAYLRGADLRGANLTGADLTGADLYGANLYGANLTGADMSGANLTGADMSGANLSRADLTGANLTGADLRDADLRDAYLTGANLIGAHLTGADLTGVREALDLIARIEAICKPRVLPGGLPPGVEAYLQPNLSITLDGRAEIEAVVHYLHTLAERKDWLNIVDVSFVRCFHTSNQQAAMFAKDDENDAGCPAYHYFHNNIHYVAIVNS